MIPLGVLAQRHAAEAAKTWEEQIADLNPLGWWNFSQVTTFASGVTMPDVSGNNRNLTFHGHPVGNSRIVSPLAPLGGGYAVQSTFTATYADCWGTPTGSWWNNDNAGFALMIFCKDVAVGLAAQGRVLISNSGGWGHSEIRVHVGQNGELSMSMTGSPEVATGVFLPTETSSSINIITFTYDKVALRLYLNGALIASQGRTDDIPNPSQRLSFMGWFFDNYYSYDYVVDEVVVFQPGSLSPGAISSIAQAAGVA